MTLTATATLTARDALSLAVIINASANTDKVFFDKGEDNGIIHLGHARGLYADAEGYRGLSHDADIRTGYLRVTLRSGMEAFFPIADLVVAEREHRFGVYDWS